MRFVNVCCLMLGVVCAKPSYDESPVKRSAEVEDKMMANEAADMDVLQARANLDVMPSVSMINTEINSANRETTTPLYGNLAKSLEEIQDLGLEEYFRDFANTEMSAFLEIIPKPLTRRLEPKSNPCKVCILKYVKCKGYCLQLLEESLGHVLDSFACIVTCWQRVAACCIASKQTPAQLVSTNK